MKTNLLSIIFFLLTVTPMLAQDKVKNHLRYNSEGDLRYKYPENYHAKVYGMNKTYAYTLRAGYLDAELKVKGGKVYYPKAYLSVIMDTTSFNQMSQQEKDNLLKYVEWETTLLQYDLAQVSYPYMFPEATYALLEEVNIDLSTSDSIHVELDKDQKKLLQELKDWEANPVQRADRRRTSLYFQLSLAAPFLGKKLSSDIKPTTPMISGLVGQKFSRWHLNFELSLLGVKPKHDLQQTIAGNTKTKTRVSIGTTLYAGISAVDNPSFTLTPYIGLNLLFPSKFYEANIMGKQTKINKVLISPVIRLQADFNVRSIYRALPYYGCISKSSMELGAFVSLGGFQANPYAKTTIFNLGVSFRYGSGRY